MLQGLSAIERFQEAASGNAPPFVFHNKMEKCGSTTMRNIIKILSKRNRYARNHRMFLFLEERKSRQCELEKQINSGSRTIDFDSLILAIRVRFLKDRHNE